MKNLWFGKFEKRFGDFENRIGDFGRKSRVGPRIAVTQWDGGIRGFVLNKKQQKASKLFYNINVSKQTVHLKFNT